MNNHYLDYFWKEGIPHGKNSVDPSVVESYVIAMDPYRKRISVEKYHMGDFERVIYDSAFINFRKLGPMHQIAWQKTSIKKESSKEVCLIRDQDNRVVLVETYFFNNDLCVECKIESPHGFYLASQKMFYEKMDDPFNGVMLFDSNNHPVMGKSYEAEEDTGLFSNVIKEEWNFGQNTLFDKATRIQRARG